MKKRSDLTPGKVKPVPFDEVVKRLLDTPPPAKRRPRAAKRAK